MRRVLLFVLLLAACGGTSGTGTPPDGGTSNTEPSSLAGITAAHNAARASVSPAAAAPIPSLVWSGTLAEAAQTWAAGCQFAHSGGPYGENLYASTGPAPSAQTVVDDWVSEQSQYDYATNTCSGTCGHYTQVVWANTLSLGCALQVCVDNSPFGSGAWNLVVCEYDPPGNVNGERPY